MSEEDQYNKEIKKIQRSISGFLADIKRLEQKYGVEIPVSVSMHITPGEDDESDREVE